MLLDEFSDMAERVRKGVAFRSGMVFPAPTDRDSPVAPPFPAPTWDAYTTTLVVCVAGAAR